MRIFGVEHDGTFKEYAEIPFQKDHEETILENWIEANPQSLLEDSGLLIIGRQVTTNLGGFIDLLGLDREGNTVVIELKRDRTPRDTLAQALEYASSVEEMTSGQLEFIFQRYLNDEATNLAEYHQQYFALDANEAVAFNKDQRVVIVGQRVSQEILQTSSFLRKKGGRVTCVEFSFFQSEQGLKLLSHEIVVGRESAHVPSITSGSLPIITEEAFLHSLDSHGHAVFTEILTYAREHSFPLHWGSKGFSLNVDKHGTHVAVCFGYPPDSVYKQSIYTALVGRGGLLSKLAISADTIAELWQEAEQSGYFQRAGKELKCVINRAFSTEEIERILAWIRKVALVVQEAELK